ncbi:MAG: carboxypeptidase regulatory-like domain-containing protein [Gemmatimonadota bacterium]|nr:carboxypeptidase regulatory-like domain-containing protein [Gemmatimonadota bacterium]
MSFLAQRGVGRLLGRGLVTLAIVGVSVAQPLSAQQPVARSEITAPPAIVQGRILGADKKGLEEAEVVVDDTARTFTDRKGRFAIDPVKAGVHEVLVRKIGFVPVRFRVAVTEGDVWDGTITLDRTAQSLPQVVVLDSTKALKNYRPRWIDGFVERRRAGLGTFLDRIDIENARAYNTAKLVATAPGIMARASSGWDELNVSRCGNGFGTASKGIVYVDGFKTETSVTGRFVTFHDYPPDRLWAIEIYKGRGVIPPMYDDPQACLVVLLWTTRR